ncbi:MAG TPA: DUF4159 domain-containing protein [Thermopetrobacter sp.]|nr:DUF4159 domain-containing protein [Thermopetrobacter sp.]
MTGWLGGIGFANPLALWALLALPAIWWLLRAVPPAPHSVRFAPYRLLLRLSQRRQQSARTPWWLVLLRLALAATLILAVAGPRLSAPRDTAAASGDGALLVIVDDGFAAAANWPAISAALQHTLTGAAGRPVIIAPTAPRAAPPSLTPMNARQATRQAAAMQPVALPPARPALLERLRKLKVKPAAIVWLSDGIDHGAAADFMAGLGKLGAPVTVHVPKRRPAVLLPPKSDQGALIARLRRAAASGPQTVRVTLRAANDRPLAVAEARFKAAAREAEAVFRLPAALRNEAAVITLSGPPHAGGVWLLDERFKRKSVLVISGETRGRGQPLLSPAYYVTRALAPLAGVREAEGLAALDDHLTPALSMLVLADVGRLDATRRAAIARWVKQGGLLLRFAGPRLANAADRTLLPVTLRAGGRQLGAALSWGTPQHIGGFSEHSPFAALTPDPQVRVTRQVLAEPGAELEGRVWARLADGTPLITARRDGRGLIVLFHVTASPLWSNLPLSGLFVRLLKRLLDLAPPARIAPATGDPAAATDPALPLAPLKSLDGFGRLIPPPADAMPLKPARFASQRPTPRHPAGLYAKGGHTRALNIGHAAMTYRALAVPAAFARAGYAPRPARDLAPRLFIAAAVLFALDLLAMLWLSRAAWPSRRAATAASLVALALLWPAAPLPAAEKPANDDTRWLQFALRASTETRLAYVLTGNREVDAISRAGLRGLSEQLTARTSVEPGAPMAIDIERDEIGFFPLIYWPVLPDAKRLSPQAVAKLDMFLKNGGTILFDTRDAPDAAISPDGLTPARRALRRLLADLDIPPLQPVPKRHVLTRSFYLLRDFPGRFNGAPLWVEATSSGREQRRLSTGNADGVSAILITGNDFAGAWAVADSGRPLLPVVPGGELQREYARRAGINIVMYALTGNYKGDQVHIPAILQRLGQ